MEKDNGKDNKPKYKNLYNPKPLRSVSNWVDSKMGWEGEAKEKSGTRGFIHGVSHTLFGMATFNGDEFKRAGEQFGRMKREDSP